MPDVSPTRWHLAHTTWFFETFVLAKFNRRHVPFDTQYEFLFNSYYNTVGRQFPRSQRGLLSRPTVKEVLDYRHEIDRRLLKLLSEKRANPAIARMVQLGLQHEQQHQELILTDIKHVFSCNPLQPVFRETKSTNLVPVLPLEWTELAGGIVEIGHDGAGFAFDNESPRHEALLQPVQIANRLVTNADFVEFIEDGGYEQPEHWLSAGWEARRQHRWHAPLYWLRGEDDWRTFTLGGTKPLDLNEPVCHVSYFEADAFARWSDARLPTEFEWEAAAVDEPIAGNFAESRRFHPAAGQDGMFGDVWQWTSSQYSPYPGYRPPNGAMGEYNGKFMCNQFVLRGGSCATSQSHLRITYRNFFPPDARWQFSGLRLARS